MKNYKFRRIKIQLILPLLISCLNCALAQSVRQDVSGVYESTKGTITIGIDHNVLTGHYDYYDFYDKTLKTFLRQNAFYIYGSTQDNKKYNIIGVPDGFYSERVKGEIVFSEKKLRIVFENTGNVNASFDITQNTDQNIFPLKANVHFTQIAYVFAKKAPLYNFDGSVFSPRKAYLLNGDVVYVTTEYNHFKKIVYKNWDTGKTAEYWIKEEDLYNSDPNTWK